MALLMDVLAGILLGMCYDLLKAFRKKIKKPFISAMADICFWGLSLAFGVRLFLLTGDRKFRFYELFGMCVGFFFYFWSVSEYFVGISEIIADIFLVFFRFLFTIVKFFGIIMKNGVLFLLKPFGCVMSFCKKRISRHLKKLKQNRKLMKRI